MDTFKAGVQYNDFKGTIAADVSDNLSLADHLVSLGQAQRNERVVAFRIGAGAIRSTPVTSVSLVAYLTSSSDFDPAPTSVRAVEVQLPPAEALMFFKRFELVAMRTNIDLSSTRVDGPHYD